MAGVTWPYLSSPEEVPARLRMTVEVRAWQPLHDPYQLCRHDTAGIEF